MTMAFDEAARRELQSWYESVDLSSVKPSELRCIQIPVKVARPFIATFHYSRTMPDSTRFAYGLEYGGRIVGVCTFGMGCGKNQYTSVIPTIQKGQYIELTRLWCEDTLGRNTESWFISRCIKRLPEEIKLILSFSDEKQHHSGTIYQAMNFFYLGVNKGGKMMVGPDGIEKHPRLIGIYRKRHPELAEKSSAEIMDMLDFKYVQGGRKRKYAFGTNKVTRKILRRLALPYPEHVES